MHHMEFLYVYVATFKKAQKTYKNKKNIKNMFLNFYKKHKNVFTFMVRSHLDYCCSV